MKCQFNFLYYVDLIMLELFADIFREIIQIYFHEQMIFKSLWQRENTVKFFWETVQFCNI